MSVVIVRPLPSDSALWDMVGPNDFIDGYAVKSKLTVDQAVQTGLTFPRWVHNLLWLRNKLVGPFGLKTEIDQGYKDTIFPVCHQTETETIVGTDDAHLNFRISVFKQNDSIHMATWVHRNNWLGRVYLAIVMPFHILIVRNSMKRIADASPIASTSAAQ